MFLFIFYLAILQLLLDPRKLLSGVQSHYVFKIVSRDSAAPGSRTKKKGSVFFQVNERLFVCYVCLNVPLCLSSKLIKCFYINVLHLNRFLLWFLKLDKQELYLSTVTNNLQIKLISVIFVLFEVYYIAETLMAQFCNSEI